MRFLYFLADAFINTFGITKPTEKARQQAAFFIMTLILIAIGIATTAFFVIHSAMR